MYPRFFKKYFRPYYHKETRAKFSSPKKKKQQQCNRALLLFKELDPTQGDVDFYLSHFLMLLFLFNIFALSRCHYTFIFLLILKCS